MARSVLALVACTILLAPPMVVAQVSGRTDQSPGAEETHAPARFDIDAQPLAAALRAYSEASGIAVLFDDALVADRRSPGVNGMVQAHDALRILLAGTGLTGHFSSMNAFTVTANDPVENDRPANGPIDDEPLVDALDAGSAASVQHAIERALCANATTRPGSYRLAMQLWIDADGSIDRVEALGGSDDPERDGRVVNTLHGVRVPSRIHRFSPVTVLLTRSADGRPTHCGPTSEAG